ncbi:MAG: hypothetical protein A2252_01555 [Elusimicrobia bacterium RIFOXYA2_FULL_39_19]|nr:MAG: hypothetical protein A2252_01555 [Elusimicrobia bacterium RIFOXYA2_FULL_39_19]
MIILFMVLSGICAFFIFEGTLALLKQNKISRRFKTHNLITYSGKKGLTESLKRSAIKIGDYIDTLKYKFVRNYLESLTKKLKNSDISEITPQVFAGYQVLAGFGMLIICFVLLSSLNVFYILISLTAGFYLPLLWINEQTAKKQRALFKCIPNALDLLTLLVEAGVDFNTAIGILVENEKNALTKELHLFQQEVKLGKNRIEALLDIASKNDNKYLSSVISSITQTLQTGTPISGTLKILSEQFRTERSTMAEKLGAQAPVKMMIPLIMLIFPTIFIMIFGPIVLSLIGGNW